MITTTATNNPGVDSACPGAFSLRTARCLGVRSALAYRPLAYDPLLPTVISKEVTHYATDLRAVITWDDDHIVVAIRGTVDLRNWILNLDVLLAGLANGGRAKVHAGFLRGSTAILPGIVDALLPAGGDKSSLPPIDVTGHSLGGSVGTLIAYALHDQGFKVRDIYTFASPRVGNAAWRDLYNAELGARTFRVVAAGDLVPLLPGLLDGYRHVGQEIYLDGNVWLNPSRWFELTHDSCRAAWALQRDQVDFILRLHSMEQDYLKLMSQAAKSWPLSYRP